MFGFNTHYYNFTSGKHTQKDGSTCNENQLVLVFGSNSAEYQHVGRTLSTRSMIKPLYDKVLVSVESEWKNEIQTPSGLTGVVFESEVYRLDGAQTKGIVKELPVGISPDHYILKNYDPFDILEIKEGDTVYFHFNEIDQDSRVEIDIFTRPLYLVKMEGIFCVVRDGKTTPIGGKILAEPIYDSEVDANTNAKIKTKNGIVTKIKRDEQYNERKARLAHFGRKLLNVERVDINIGDVFYYTKDADLMYEIEGKKYLVMNQEDIIMVEK